MVHVCKKLQSGCRTGWMLLLAAAMLIVSAPVLAQQRATVTGTVTDQSGQPVIGATVIEQGHHQRCHDGRRRHLYPQTQRGGGILLT